MARVIRLITLGRLSAEVDGAELDWLMSQRLRAALLVYLAVERRVSRASLAAAFWPESDEENAPHALRQILYHLRKALGEGWIETRSHELRVTPRVRTDAEAFESSISMRWEGSTSRQAGRCGRCPTIRRTNS